MHPTTNLRLPPLSTPLPFIQDEDFVVHTFGIKMLDLPGEKPVKAALQALALAEEQLEQLLAAGAGSDTSRGGIPISGADKGRSGAKSGTGSGKGGARQPAAAPPPASERCPVAASGAAQQPALEQGQREEPSGELAAALLARIRFRRLVLEALHSLQQYSQAGVEQARRCCRLADAQLQLVADSASLAAPAGEAPGFVPDVNLRHMGLVPPRPVQARLG